MGQTHLDQSFLSELDINISEEQRMELMKEFEKNPYILAEERWRLSKKTSLSEEEIRIWFKNRRQEVSAEKVNALFDMNEEQKMGLLKEFRKSENLTLERGELLSKEINLREDLINIWFYNMRHELETDRENARLARKDKKPTVSAEQRMQLLKEFEKNPYISNEERSLLSEKLNLSEGAIKIWFQNMRCRMNRFERESLVPLAAKTEPESCSRKNEMTTAGLDINDSSSEIKEEGEKKGISEEQSMEFLKEFDKNQYLSSEERILLSKKTNLSEETIKKWFQNKREELKDESTSAALNMNKRWLITKEQQTVLLKEFEESTYLSSERRSFLSKQINLSEAEVKKWFQLMLYKAKKEKQSAVRNIVETEPESSVITTEMSCLDVNDSSPKNKDEIETISEEQKMEMLKELDEKRYLSSEYRILLSKKTNLSEETIKIWFQNKREERKSATLTLPVRHTIGTEPESWYPKEEQTND